MWRSDDHERGRTGQPPREGGSHLDYWQGQQDRWRSKPGVDLLTPVLWVLFVLPLKLIWWTLTGKTFKWMFGTWLGRLTTLVAAALAGSIAYIQLTSASFDSRLAEWWASNPEDNATVYIDSYTYGEFSETLSCRLATLEFEDTYFTRPAAGCSEVDHPAFQRLHRYVLIKPNRHQPDRAGMFTWDVYVVDDQQPGAPPNFRRRTPWIHTLERTGSGFAESEAGLMPDWQQSWLTRIEFDERPPAQTGQSQPASEE